MNFGDFDRLGLVPNLPPRAELPSALRLALAMTSLLPVELVPWVASAPLDAVASQMRQAVMVHVESKNEAEAEQAVQLVRLCLHRLDQAKTPAPIAVPRQQLRLTFE